VTLRRKRREARLPANADQHANCRPDRRDGRICADMLPTPTPTAPEGPDISRHGCAHATQLPKALVFMTTAASTTSAAETTETGSTPRDSCPDRRRRSVTTQRAARAGSDARAAEATATVICPLAAAWTRTEARTRRRRRAPSHRVDYRGLSKSQSPYPTRAVLPALADRASHGLVPLQGVPFTASVVGFFPQRGLPPPYGLGSCWLGDAHLPGLPKAPRGLRSAPHTIDSHGLSHTAARRHPCTGSPEF
jgi:hypothetical protein